MCDNIFLYLVTLYVSQKKKKKKHSKNLTSPYMFINSYIDFAFRSNDIEMQILFCIVNHT